MKNLFKGALTIPNLLCVIRIILVPVFAVLFIHGYNVDDQRYKIAAVIVLIISGLTDFFDGKIARRFNQVSELGKILDPVADKITQLTLAVMLLILFLKSDNAVIRAFGWVFVVFLAKEAVMVIGGLLMLLFGLKPGAAEMPGKVATMVFYIVMILIVAFGPGIGVFVAAFMLPDIVVGILVSIAAICTIVAFCSYMPETHRQVQYRFSEEGKARRKEEKEKATDAEFIDYKKSSD